MKSSANTRLAKGTVVYMIGNVSSKILQMLILPIITGALSTSDYGVYDLVITTISLISPVITCQIIEGMFRFMFDAERAEQKRTVSSVTTFLIVGALFLAAIVSAFHTALTQYGNPIFIYFNYIAYILLNYMQKLARCQSKNKEFAASGVINTVIMLGLQALFLLVFGMGIDGMILATCLSHFLASVYLAFYLKIRDLFSVNEIDYHTIKRLLHYSLPLVPNSIGWWIVASSDRYVITYFLSSSFNGIYSIAGKFSQLLTFVTSVFQLAWQESAIIEANSEERDIFYTNTFNIYMKLLMGGFLAVLPFIKLIFPILINDNFREGYLYNPILLIGAVFSAFSQFYGSAYLVFKKTGGAFSTTVIAAIINISIGVGLINRIGLFAPALGTAISFCVQWILRSVQMREFFKVKIEMKSFIILAICIILSCILYYIDSNLVQIISFIIGCCLFCCFNYSLIKGFISRIAKH